MKAALQLLTHRLAELGYAELLGSCVPVAESPLKWQLLRARADRTLAPLIDLLLLGRETGFEDLDATVADCVRKLTKSGLFRVSGDGKSASTANLVLVCVWGIWLFHERPNPKISIYFGDDSLALMARQIPKRGGKSLDLCSGPGIQALYAASRGENVTSVEINPAARDIALINARMNGLDDLMDIRLGNLYDAIGEEEKFDRIIANPPLLPMPEEVSYPFIGHGGKDGLAVTWKILEGMGPHLAAGGTGQVLGASLSDGETPLFIPRLRELSARQGLDARVTVMMHESIRDGKFMDSLALSSRAYGGGDTNEIRAKMVECFTAQGAAELISYYIHLTRGDGKVRVCDLGKDVKGVLWYV